MSPPHAPVRLATPRQYRSIASAPPVQTSHQQYLNNGLYDEPEAYVPAFTQPQIRDPNTVQYSGVYFEQTTHYDQRFPLPWALHHENAPENTPYWMTNSYPPTQSIRSDSGNIQLQTEDSASRYSSEPTGKYVTCKGCLRSISRHNYFRHRKTSCSGNEGKTRLSCNCGQTFSRKDTLDRHLVHRRLGHLFVQGSTLSIKVSHFPDSSIYGDDA